MAATDALQIPTNRLVKFSQRWQITELALFGSVLRDDFGPESDVDILVSFAQDAKWSLLDLATMEEELEIVLGREVDLVERQAVEQSENYIRRRHILGTTEPIYVAR
jgi:predicted nucleotidyltransferase